MALKRKLSKTDYEALSDTLKGEYKEKSGEYFLDVDGDEDITPLKNANERNKAERDQALKEKKELQDRLDAIEADKNKGDFDAMNKSWQTKHDKTVKEAAAKEAKLQSALSKKLVDNEAERLATKLSAKNAKVLMPLIKMRLAADFEGDEPTTRILDADGKVSALTIAELEAEYIANPDYSGIIDGSKASGGAGAGNKQTTTSGAGNQPDKPVNLATASIADVKAAMQAKVDAAS